MHILPVSPSKKIDALRSNPYFSTLHDALLSVISRGMDLRTYESGEVIFWEGTPCAGLHFTRRGSVKLFKTSPLGRELIINVYDEGATFNEVPVFDGGLNPVNVAALETCEVWVVQAAVIQEVIKNRPEMYQVVISNLSKNLRMFVEKVEELSFYQVTNKLASLIKQLPEEQLYGDGAYVLTLDQMAARLATVWEVVARSLRELERSGAIRVNRRKIQIVDPDALSLWSQAPCE